MNLSRVVIACAATLFLATAGSAEETTPGNPPMEMKASGTPGKVVGSRTHKITANVTALDVAKREIVIEAVPGRPVTFVVDPDVRNLDQVHIGDRVVLEYSEGLMMQMQAPGAAPVAPKVAIEATRSKPGAEPGGGLAATVEGTVTITAIDPKNRMVVFKAPGGELYQVKAAPGVHLEKAKVGDQLVATYTQSVALRVEPAAPSASGAKAAPPKK